MQNSVLSFLLTLTPLLPLEREGEMREGGVKEREREREGERESKRDRKTERERELEKERERK